MARAVADEGERVVAAKWAPGTKKRRGRCRGQLNSRVQIFFGLIVVQSKRTGAKTRRGG